MISLTGAAVAGLRRVQPRYWLHAGAVVVITGAIAANSLPHAQALTVKLSANKVGYGSSLDAQSTAAVVAEVADKSNLLVASEATQTAKTLSAQTALVTNDPEDLAKRQVVSTAGDASRDITSYTVQSDDTLSSIATHFGITTDTVLWANNLTDPNAIKPGQSLIILPVSGLYYTVQGGDTAASLASQYQANAAQITSYNDAEMTGLVPGSKIIIPDGVEPQPAAAAVAAPVQSVLSVAQPTLTHFAYAGNGYAYGYCTWYVASLRSVPSYWGNAVDWYYDAQASGFSVGSTPVAGAIAWTSAGYYGHVAYVQSASDGMVTISEMNGPAGWGRVDTRTVPASSFLYIY